MHMMSLRHGPFGQPGQLLVLVLLWFLSASSAAESNERYPARVYQATYLLSFFQESRHLRLLYECIQNEDPAATARAHSGAAPSRHGLRRLRSLEELDQSNSVLVFVNGKPYVIAHKTGQAALSRFIETLLAHPKFEELYEKYVSKLELRERIAVGALQLAYSKPELVRTLGMGFVQKHILELSNKNVRRLKLQTSP